MKQRHRLGQIDDVDVVARPVDERRHLRVPTVGLMTKMHASLEELAHGDIRQCHGTACSFFRFCRRGMMKTGLKPDHRSEREGQRKGLATLMVPRVRWCGL